MKKLGIALIMMISCIGAAVTHAYAVDTKFCWPVEAGTFSSNTENGVRHDIAVVKDTPIYAACDGTATLYQRYKTDNNKLISYGNFIVLTATTDDGASIKIIYAHLNSFAKASLKIPSENFERKSVSAVKYWRDEQIAQYPVRKGELIGYSGNVGNTSGAGGGYHLHFELYIGGKRKEPTQYLSVRPSQVSSPQAAIKPNLEATGIFSKGQIERIYDHLFNAVTYANYFPDVKAAYGSGTTEESAIRLWNHFHAFCLNGKEPNRLNGFSPVFQPDYYLNINKDVSKAYNGDWFKGLQHFVVYGAKEARNSHPEFSVSNYKSRYSDLQKAYGDNMDMYYRHYVRHGLAEGRNPK